MTTFLQAQSCTKRKQIRNTRHILKSVTGIFPLYRFTTAETMHLPNLQIFHGLTDQVIDDLAVVHADAGQHLRITAAAG